ncbi:hypothetical protein GCM10027592_05170 [Spirosoma flavus]
MPNDLQFDNLGYLIPYSGIPTDLTIIERVFVVEFAESKTRRKLFDAYQRYTENIQANLPTGATFTQWIDGSFVTRKLNPNDIDVVTFIDFQLYEQYELFFESLRQLRHLGQKDVDGYFVKVYPVNHLNYKLFDLDRADWSFRFNTPKPKGNKGFLELTY